MQFANILIATFIVSSGALVGSIVLSLDGKRLHKILLLLVSLSAGTFMGGAFIHLLPEAVEELGSTLPFYIALASFIVFFLIEKMLHWHHCHNKDCEEEEHRTFGYLNLIGDSVHNFLDGLIIAATFVTNSELGVAATVAIALHEIPQEIGDFGVLLQSGMTKKKALIANYLVALTVVIGGVVGYILVHRLETLIPLLLPFAAGGFLYIAASDLMPEIKKENNTKKALASLAIFLLGVAVMIVIKD